MPSVTTQLHQLDERACEVGGMNECNAGPSTPDSGFGVDETCPARSEVVQSGVDRSHCVGNVMQALTTLGQEPAHRGFRAQRLEELNEGATHGDHRLLDSLALHRLAIERLDPIPLTVSVDGRIEIFDGDGDVVEIE